MTTQSSNKFAQEINYIRFLREFTKLRSKLVKKISSYESHIWLDDIEESKYSQVKLWRAGSSEKSDETSDDEAGGEADEESFASADDTWLRLRDYTEPKLPALPKQLRENDLEPIFREAKSADDIYAAVDDGRNSSALKQYVEEKWPAWHEAHIKWQEQHKLYSDLYKIHSQIGPNPQNYEIILSVGFLEWSDPGQKKEISRHLITSSGVLDFNAARREFIFRSSKDDDANRLELEIDVLEDRIPAPEKLSEYNTQLRGGSDGLLNQNSVREVLKSIGGGLSQDFEFADLRGRRERSGPHPRISLSPALVFRKRSDKNLEKFMGDAIEGIEKGKIKNVGLLSDAVSASMGREGFSSPESRRVGGAAGSGDQPKPKAPEKNVYFPKPWNNDQLRIAGIIQQEKALLVQGPPGTGKSHTIANLICHFLAEGKKVLITAKTPNALRALHQLIPEPVRGLSVNMLGKGADERKSLQDSVTSILDNTSGWDEYGKRAKIDSTKSRLSSIRTKTKRLKVRARDLREADAKPVADGVGVYQGTSASIVKQVNADARNYGWFADDPGKHKENPIGLADLRKLLKGLRSFKHREEEFGQWWQAPPMGEDKFSKLVGRERKLRQLVDTLKEEIDPQLADLLGNNDEQAGQLRSSAIKMGKQLASIDILDDEQWKFRVVAEILAGQHEKWAKLGHKFDGIVKKIQSLCQNGDLASLLELEFQIPDGLDRPRIYSDTKILLKHFDNGGRIGWWKFRNRLVKERLYLLETMMIDNVYKGGRREIGLLHKSLGIQELLEQFASAWHQEGLPGIDTNKDLAGFFQAVTDATEQLGTIVSIAASAKEYRIQLSAVDGLDKSQWLDLEAIKRLVATCRFVSAKAKQVKTMDRLAELENFASSVDRGGELHPVMPTLLDAIQNRHTQEYRECLDRITSLNTDKPEFKQHKTLERRLNKFFPKVIGAMDEGYQDSVWEERIENFIEAFEWAKAKKEIEALIAESGVDKTIAEIKSLEDQERKTLGELAVLYAWSKCNDKMDGEIRTAMKAWMSSVKKLGKGTGKKAHVHRAAAKKHMEVCKKAIPAFIMPLTRVWDNFAPASGVFDVVIVDEASQCEIDSMMLFLMTKKIIIVGDDMQISPYAINISSDRAQHLIDKHLKGYTYRELFDPESSLFDHGKILFKYDLLLQEHFRCMPEIINFSNEQCYQDKLIPLRQYGHTRLKPLERVFVGHGRKEEKGNRKFNMGEVQAITDRIVEICSDSAYKGKDIGVISLLGPYQAELVQSMLLDRLGPEEITKRRIVCGDSSSFQGDERDIILLSMVADGHSRNNALTRLEATQRFNVAASRAKDQMILFHSVEAASLSSECVRRKLIEFFSIEPKPKEGVPLETLREYVESESRALGNHPEPFDSWFEVDVALEIAKRNYKVIPQWRVAQRRIDLVVSGGGSRLAVECDGDNWHGPEEFDRDIERQRQLERCGWEFFRVRESVFYADPKEALSHLWEKLSEKRIYPQDYEEPAVEEQGESNGLKTDSMAETPDTAEEPEAIWSNEDSDAQTDSANQETEPADSFDIEVEEAIIRAVKDRPRQKGSRSTITWFVLKELNLPTGESAIKLYKDRILGRIDNLLGQGQLVQLGERGTSFTLADNSD